MEIRVEELSGVKRKLEVVIPREKVNAEIEVICQKLRKQAKVKGFRPGKVPISILKRLYHQDVISQAMLKLIEQTYQEALDEAKLKPLFEPTIDPEVLEEGKAFKYTATLEIMPDIKLEEYKGLELEVPPLNINEEAINQEMEKLRETHAEIANIKEDRPLKLGDYAIIDFQGYLGETPMKELKAENFMVELGNQQLSQDMEKSLLGAKKGEERIIKIKSPKDHQNPNLADKEVEVRIKVKDIKEKILPEIDDEFAKQVGDYENLEQLRKALYKTIEERAKVDRDIYIKNEIVKQLMEKTEIEIPEGLTEQEMQAMINRATYSLSPQAKASLDFKKTKENLRPLAEKKAKRRLILNKIAEMEDIQSTEKELEENLSAVAAQLKTNVESLKNSYAEQRLREHILEEKTLNFLRDHTKIAERSIEK